MGLGAAGLGLAATFPGCVSPQGTLYGHLPRSTPEAEGVDSAAILGFLDAAAKSKHEFHSFMMVRHGRVMAEGWWTPYRADARHMLYSLSKSFTSTAVGFAVTEGKLSVEDQVISFFPNDLPPGDKITEHLRALKVKHLLTMSVGRSHDSMPIIAKSENWVQTFLAAPIERPPGSIFLYDSGATYMLSAIVQKVTGRKVIDYLRPRLFSPLEIHGMTWEVSPQGINTGGWGLSVPTEALAKFGQFYLQNGAWDGKQILPAAWVHEATTFKIQQPPTSGPEFEKFKVTSDWHQGYCYQFWRCRHDAFRGDGAYGQFMIVMPDEDAVVAITCQTSDMQGELNLVWDHVLPGIKDASLPPAPDLQRELRRRMAALALPLAQGQLFSLNQNRVSGHIYTLEPNDLGLKTVSFKFPYYPPLFGFSVSVNTNNASFNIPDQGVCGCIFTDDDGQYLVHCGLGKWFEGTCNVPGTPPALTAGKLRPCKVAASAAWKDPVTLEMIWRYFETPHHHTITSHFEDDKIRIEFDNNLPGQKQPALVLRGRT